MTETGAAIIMDAATSGISLSYSRTARHYEGQGSRYFERLYTYRHVVGAVDHLDNLGLIDHDRIPPGQRGWQSSILARPELIDGIERLVKPDDMKITARGEVIRLRDRAGNLVNYNDDRRTARMRRSTEELNEAITGAELHPSINARVVRIFTNEFNLHGRFYAMGSSWQNIKSEARRQITIAGEAVVELDFKTMHPALLYAQTCVAMPSDCYAIAGFPRELIKHGLLILINARDKASARRAIAFTEAMGVHAERGSQAAFQMAQSLIEAIKRVHHHIDWAFHKDMGLRLMATDAAIAEEVMRIMLRQGVVVLPVHDSFLVPASKAELLLSAMMEAAQNVVGTTLKVEAK